MAVGFSATGAQSDKSLMFRTFRPLDHIPVLQLKKKNWFAEMQEFNGMVNCNSRKGNYPNSVSMF